MKKIRKVFLAVLTIFVALVIANPVNAQTVTLDDIAQAFNESENIDAFINNEINRKLLNESVDINTSKEVNELYKIFESTIKSILYLKPFISKLGSKPVKKMEFLYMKNYLMKKGYNVDKLFYGCLDCMKDI